MNLDLREARQPRKTAYRFPADQETRQRLFDVAARLFAERGFKKVTVREICRMARANVASVNYHFGDKLGLYTAVVWAAIEHMQKTGDAVVQAGKGLPPEEKLRSYLRVYLRRVVSEGRGSWIHKLIAHELADPTPALNLVVERAIRPRIAYLSAVVSELLGCDPKDRRVTRCVVSIQGQCLINTMDLFSPVTARLGAAWQVAPGEINELAGHIAAFSLAGIRALAHPAANRPSASD
ncbi:MAG: CerR family C-terminal domain-containing protein [Acidobacteria bacterium]|nr:CerR family C-terminal domain-containing protein [Acidobacteriota bacterium]